MNNSRDVTGREKQTNPGGKKTKSCYRIPLSVISIQFESNCFPPCTFGVYFMNFYQINVKGEQDEE